MSEHIQKDSERNISVYDIHDQRFYFAVSTHTIIDTPTQYNPQHKVCKPVFVSPSKIVDALTCEEIKALKEYHKDFITKYPHCKNMVMSKNDYMNVLGTNICFPREYQDIQEIILSK